MIGETIAHYRITAKLGEGGMGEVYRARDTKLDRDVAIKILPAAFASDADRMARFRREAQILASLNHPNIAHIYGVEERALVMELVEGETLKGPLPLETALNYAKQIADALEAAHEKGITHRDLKPANIMITPAGVVKVLDFGLAAVAQDPASGGTDPSNSPTLTMRATQVGMIMGTAAYMSPEQAAGKPVDKRADIWAFGVVLFELLTGRQLFGEGETISHTLADVLRAPIDFDNLPRETPKAIRDLLRRCLDRDVKNRLRDVGEARVAIASASKEQPDAVETAPVPTVRVLPWAVGAVTMTMIALALGFGYYRATRPIEHPLMRMSVDLGQDAVAGIRATVAISPDGTRIVYPVRGTAGEQQLATRLLDQMTATPLPGTTNAADPFFSPDGQWIGFFADGKLKKISVLGGAAVTLCDAQGLRGGSWNDDGNIIAALGAASGLSRVSADGGVPQPLTKLAEGEATHRWPQVLPDGSAVLFTASQNTTGRFDDANIKLLSLKTGEIKTLVKGGNLGRYLPTGARSGYLIYIHEGTLLAASFDLAKLELRGPAVPVLEDMYGDAFGGSGQLTFSRTGTFVYRSGKPSAQGYPVLWLDSTGKAEPLIAVPGVYAAPHFSPDGQRLLLVAQSAKGRDVYVYDLLRGAMSRLTFTGGSSNPVWTPDGKHVVYWSGGSFWWIRADGAGEPQHLLESKNPLFANSFSPDGHRLAYYERTPETNANIWTLPLDLSDPEHPSPGKPELFLRTPYNEGVATFSPDGRWLSYASDESGRLEVYVRPFPGPGGKWQISTAGATYSFWSRDGRELFYRTADNRIMLVDYAVKGDSFTAGKPRVWSVTQVRPTPEGSPALDLAPDGKRFAILPDSDAAQAQTGSVHVMFLLNFFDELRRRVPISK